MINYYLLTKPGIIMGNLITVTAGFLLAAQGSFDLFLFVATFLGLALVMASACVFNNYIDRQIDQKMERTKNRVLARGLISSQQALLFATILGIFGSLTLFCFTNTLTAVIAAFGFFVYVILYSIWKRHTLYGTAIGSMAGAVPPVVGYCAVNNHLDMGAIILFTMLVFWQMPHFFSIAVYRVQDYTAASIPVLPVKKGIEKTKKRMLLYIVGFIAVAITLTLCHYTGYIYLVSATLLGILWLWLCLKGFNTANDQLWARDMFRLSLLVITTICIVIPFDLVKT